MGFGEKQGPFQVQIHLTNFCNLQCFFCPTRALVSSNELRTEDELTLKEWLAIIDQANNLGVQEWHICGGGEPLFFMDKAVGVVDKIIKEGKRCEIITNGTLFTVDCIHTFLEVDKITFSIDGSNAKIHESIRGKKCFDALISNIRLFKKYKGNKPRIAFHVVISNKNYKDLTNILKLAKGLAVDDVLINALNIWSEETKKLALNTKQKLEFMQILKKADSFAVKNQIHTNFTEFFDLNLFDKANIMDTVLYNSNMHATYADAACFMPWYNISIFANGETKPCFILKEKGPSLKAMNVKSVWEGDFFINVRNDMLAHKANPSCNRCNPWSLCKNTKIREAMKK